jgi:hypothetical protein
LIDIDNSLIDQNLLSANLFWIKDYRPQPPGVRLVRQDSDDKLAAITPLAKEEEDEDDDTQEELPLKK